MVELNPSGPMNLRGNFDVERAGLPADPLQWRWDMRLGVQQAASSCGGIGAGERLHGEVSLRGGFDGQHLQSRGELALDSLSYKECQFTRVTGPIWIDDDRVLFGTWVDRPQSGAAAERGHRPGAAAAVGHRQPLRRHASTATAGSRWAPTRTMPSTPR